MTTRGRSRRPLAAQDRPAAERDVVELPYRSDLMASLGALLNLWDSPSSTSR
ncbi:hypothetical protein SAMN04488544_0541 [Microlunatus sagamiharensis]|uniref:Uncharacterized protein n=1 Tax=Microlunatus sagamiharensis TaxID=546874 RepID=A0A1H2LNS9_9ACTN|nr:hypothetical protein [Microlunatus sagamiharensis]SDU82494.1 hypothetical protein SAMN04488544_0541 [Microlunatus sagamiharensis]